MASLRARALLDSNAIVFKGAHRGAGRALLIALAATALMVGSSLQPLAALAAGAPSVTANTPGEGTIGSLFTITGTNLKRAATPAVTLKPSGGGTGVKLALKSNSATQITAKLNAATKPGLYNVQVKWGTALKVIAPTLFMAQPPLDPMVAPEAGSVGSVVTLSADFLGTTKGSVLIDATAANIVGWAGTTDATPGTVAFKVPGSLKNGFHSLKVANKVAKVDVDSGFIVTGQPDHSGIDLRVSNAAATSNTQILVQFSKAVDPRKAELPDHYRITAVQGAATVQVIAAELERPNLTTVRLTTLPQSEIDYKLKVTDIVDLAGNPLASPSGTLPSDPSLTTFHGYGSGDAGQADSDLCEPDADHAAPWGSCPDGVTDADEQRGYTITIVHTDGTTETRTVTSDPYDPDTDNDGVTDDQEKHAGTDPRSPDTDGDTLSDNIEWNILLSSPSDQDTDNDGLPDGYEYGSLGTSPLLADTDGDQISDGDEVFSRNRNPLVADLPAEMISVGDVRLQLDQRFTYVDETGHTVSTTASAASTLETDTSSTHTSGEDLTLGGSLWVEAGSRDGTTGNEGFFRAHGEFNAEHTSSWTDESVRATQLAYQDSLEQGNELSTASSVAREVTGASISADVTIENRGDIAFSIGSVEITVSERSPGSTSELTPVATLIANTTLTTGGDVTFQLGPFNRTRGPVVFSSRDVFPNLVEQLMRDPGALVFTIGNFDMTDELGRHFTYSEQIARDRTGGILIDAGDGNVTRSLVATSLQFDPDHVGHRHNPAHDDDPTQPEFLDYVGGFNDNGSPIGIPLDFALQHILGMTKNGPADGIVSSDGTVSSRATGDDIQLIPVHTTGVPVGSIIISAGHDGILDSQPLGTDVADATTGYETEIQDGVERLVRLGSERNGDLNREWWIGTAEEIPAGADFGKLMLLPGHDFYFVFAQDLDQDGLFARTEALVGSTDSLADIYQNSTFGKVNPVRAHTSDPFTLIAPTLGADDLPDSQDTDRDGLGDFAEVRVGWRFAAENGLLAQVYSNPRLADSDGDGLLDPQEQDLRSFCLLNDPRIDALCQAQPVVSQEDAIAIIAGSNGTADTAAANGDVQLIPVGTTGLTYATRIIGPGDNGKLDTPLPAPDPNHDDLYISTLSSRQIPPASNPQSVDTDADRVTDFEELTGYTVGQSIRDGTNKTAESLAIGDDVQQARLGAPVFTGGIVVLPGPNGTIESAQGGDDHTSTGQPVTTDPLRRDTDSDLISDGRERETGSDPTNPLDAQDFKDSDQDGLADSEESVLGWDVTVNGNAPYHVLSSPSRPDSDGDGLPDLAERQLGTDPNRVDTDHDGLSDFDEVGDFGQFQGMADGNPGFVLVPTASKQYGTNPTKLDSDSDGLDDKQELITGYHMMIAGESQPRWIHTNPNYKDTDYDGVDDAIEWMGSPQTDAADPDTDDDGRSDGTEETNGTDPLVRDLLVTVAARTLYLNHLTDYEVAWFYTLKQPRLPATQLLSDACTAGIPNELNKIININDTDNCFTTDNADVIPHYTNACHWIRVDPVVHYSLDLNEVRTFALRPGESFTVKGELFQFDDASNDCGVAPTYIPSWINAAPLSDPRPCVTTFSQVFNYNDLNAGGKANFPFPNAQGTVCDWTQEIYVTAQ